MEGKRDLEKKARFTVNNIWKLLLKIAEFT